jgi:hypothetical protein
MQKLGMRLAGPRGGCGSGVFCCVDGGDSDFAFPEGAGGEGGLGHHDSGAGDCPGDLPGSLFDGPGSGEGEGGELACLRRPAPPVAVEIRIVVPREPVGSQSELGPNFVHFRLIAQSAEDLLRLPQGTAAILRGLTGIVSSQPW